MRVLQQVMLNKNNQLISIKYKIYAYDILDVQTYIHNGKKKKKVKKKKRRVGGTDYMSSRASHDSNLLLKTPVISQPQTLQVSPEKHQPLIGVTSQQRQTLQVSQSQMISHSQDVTMVAESAKVFKLRRDSIRKAQVYQAQDETDQTRIDIRKQAVIVALDGAKLRESALALDQGRSRMSGVTLTQVTAQPKIPIKSRVQAAPVQLQDRSKPVDQQQPTAGGGYIRSQSAVNLKAQQQKKQMDMIVDHTKQESVREESALDRLVSMQLVKPSPLGVPSTIKELKTKMLSDKNLYLQDGSTPTTQVEESKEPQLAAMSLVPGNLQQQEGAGLEIMKREVSSDFPIHALIYKKDFVRLVQYFKRGAISADDLNQRDLRGNTPIILAAKLSPFDDEYLKAVNYLFEKGANGKLRDSNGWSLMDEAISQQNTRLLAIAFDQLNKRKKDRWERTKLTIFRKLKLIPDFYVELHWECQSTWIPFLSKIAPNDTFQIWKVGSFLRLDFSLVGFSKLQTKRRRMSILFRDTSEVEDDYKHIDIMLVNKDRKILVNPLEDLDMDEKLAVLTDIINSEPLQNELNIEEQEWRECRSFLGNLVQETVNEYLCTKYKVIVKAHALQRKKVHQRLELPYEEYFNQEKSSADAQAAVKVAKDVKKVVESQLWLSNEFPLKISNFLTVLKTLSIGGNANMSKLKDFLKNQSLKEVITQNGFPVKVQIPIGLLIKATVDFNKFQYLHNTPEYVKEIFSVPADCQYVSRKEGMKTLQNKKKRLAMANVAT